MGEVFVVDGLALAGELTSGGVGVDGVPGEHAVGDQVEALGLEVLVARAALVELAAVGMDDPAAQGVDGSAAERTGLGGGPGAGAQRAAAPRRAGGTASRPR